MIVEPEYSNACPFDCVRSLQSLALTLSQLDQRRRLSYRKLRKNQWLKRSKNLRSDYKMLLANWGIQQQQEKPPRKVCLFLSPFCCPALSGFVALLSVFCIRNASEGYSVHLISSLYLSNILLLLGVFPKWWL